ncbi:hypothetical protein [Terrihabitans sp. B22-R8]|uniref:hypothetical protein n=1 Tax=Terrihabitans sp. B22-R8 TaxID=3425128 RepID=UPI00403C0379
MAKALDRTGNEDTMKMDLERFIERRAAVSVPRMRLPIAVMVCTLMSMTGIASAYTTDELFSTRTEEGPGYIRQSFDLGAPELAFTAIVADGVDVRVLKQPGDDGLVARIFSPETDKPLAIEIYRIEFPSFAQAITAGHGFLAQQGFDRILRDEVKSNHAFALLSAAEERGEGAYGKMARAAVISRGNVVLIAVSIFDYADYPRHEPVLARFFGGLRMSARVDLAARLKTVSVMEGSVFLVPGEWSVEKTGKAAEANAADYSLELTDDEYPNISCQIRPGTIAEGRALGVQMAKEFSASITASPKARLDAAPELKTYNAPSGDIVGYSFAQAWTATEYALPMVAQFNVQLNSNRTLGICGVNAFDGQRTAGQDSESADIIYRNWVVGLSAFALARLSLRDGVDAVRADLDVSGLGH